MVDFAALRKGAGFSVAEVAAEFGSNADRVAEWENGTANPPVHIVQALKGLSFAEASDPPQASESRLAKRDRADGQQAFPWLEQADSPSQSRTGAFVDNMKLPIHRWFRYSAGFSAAWVSEVVGRLIEPGDPGLLFDPFAGSGTSLLAAQSAGVANAGAERHPFVHRVAQAKLRWHVDPAGLKSRGSELIERARRGGPLVKSAMPGLLSKCYSPEALDRLERLRDAYLAEDAGVADAISELLWLAITSILRECSEVGTAQWQYVLPNKSKARVADPYLAFQRRIDMFTADIIASKVSSLLPPTQILAEDARDLQGFADLKGQVSLIVTSPPYPNNFDYADATRLEMTFWREVESWSGLQEAVRHRLVRSCSQHSAAERLNLDALLNDSLVAPISKELGVVCRELAAVRETKGGRKTYHTMVAAYFADLARVWHALRPLCRKGADICFVVGDSAPYGVHVPVDRWLAELALAAGFREPRFEKIRDRNLKWKNRKHRVPLKEGNLWLKG